MSTVSIHPAVIANRHKIAALESATGMRADINWRTCRAHLAKPSEPVRLDVHIFSRAPHRNS